MAQLKNSYDQDVVNYVKESLEDEKEFHFLRLEYLQRINVVHQQLKLVRAKCKFQREGQALPFELDALAVTLRDYSKASFLLPFIDDVAQNANIVSYCHQRL